MRKENVFLLVLVDKQVGIARDKAQRKAGLADAVLEREQQLQALSVEYEDRLRAAGIGHMPQRLEAG